MKFKKLLYKIVEFHSTFLTHSVTYTSLLFVHFTLCLFDMREGNALFSLYARIHFHNQIRAWATRISINTHLRILESMFPIIPTEYVFVFGSTDIVAMGNCTILSSSLVPLYRKVSG